MDEQETGRKTRKPGNGLSLYSDLYQRNLYFNMMLENSGDAFLIVNRDGLIVEINKQYCDFLKARREDVIGRPVLELIPNSRLPEVLRTGESHIDDIQTYSEGHTSGELFTVVCRMPIWDGDVIIAAMGIVRFPKRTMELARTIQDLGEELAFYRQELERHGMSKFHFRNMTSISRAFNAAKKLAERFARNDLPVLLLGETGVGKEGFATAIHHASERRRGPLIRVNCAAIPAELFESELFGYAEGAFTGSRKGGRKGKFELADGGTLFLDEVGDLPFSMQAKLLRVLQENEVEKIGSEKPIPVDVRIIAATNQDLKRKIEEKAFRVDLFYRLNVLSVEIPALRERMGDLPVLSANILRELGEVYGRTVSLSQAALGAMRAYAWPGNIRELRNELGRAFMLTEGNSITPRDLSFGVRTAEASTGLPPQDTLAVAAGPVVDDGGGPTAPPPPAKDFSALRADSLERERDLVLATLEACRYNCTRAARRLGIHRTALYARMKALGLDIHALRRE